MVKIIQLSFKICRNYDIRGSHIHVNETHIKSRDNSIITFPKLNSKVTDIHLNVKFDISVYCNSLCVTFREEKALTGNT